MNAPTRRRVLRGMAATLALLLAAPRPADAATLAALRRLLPSGLDPLAIGAALRAAHPGCTRADCLAHAALADLAALPSVVADDFAAGRIMQVAGWQLSRTEAWLCAALVRGS